MTEPTEAQLAFAKELLNEVAAGEEEFTLARLIAARDKRHAYDPGYIVAIQSELEEIQRSYVELMGESATLRAQRDDARRDYMDLMRERNELHGQLAEARALLARMTEAMRLWGSWEDGIPEDGPIAEAYDAAVALLTKEPSE